MLRSVCPQCGTPFERTDSSARCPVCLPVRSSRPNHAWKGSPRTRGYDATWDRLSLRARKLQPFCSDCGSVHDLTADHTPEAWARKARGQSIRLRDIDVVCRRCNAERGAARGESARADADDSLSALADVLADDEDA